MRIDLKIVEVKNFIILGQCMTVLGSDGSMKCELF